MHSENSPGAMTCPNRLWPKLCVSQFGGRQFGGCQFGGQFADQLASSGRQCARPGGSVRQFGGSVRQFMGQFASLQSMGELSLS